MRRGTKPTDYFPTAPHAIPLVDLVAARSAVRKARSLDLADISIDDLKVLIEPLFKGVVCTAPIFEPGSKLFRARRGLKMQNIREALYPPPDTAPLGRANRAGSSLFYCCNSRHGPYDEIPLVPGDILTLTRWVATESILVNSVGYSESTFRGLRSKRDVKAAVRLPPGKLARQISTELIDFLSDLFTRPPAAVPNRDQ